MSKLDELIQRAKLATEWGLDTTPILNELKKLADGTGSGDAGNTADFGTPVSQEYANDRADGAEPYGENSPGHPGDERFTGPRDDNDTEMARRALEQETTNVNQEQDHFTTTASSNKPCVKCGLPTDKCQCMDAAQPQMGNAAPKVAPELDPMKQADLKVVKDAIRKTNALYKSASHIEQIEVPIKDLHLEPNVNYHMTNQKQSVEMLLVNYLKENVYGLNSPFTIARIEQEGNTFYVSILVFDKQLAYGAGVTNDKNLRKGISEDKKLTKTAWRRRTVSPVGKNDKTGLVACPIEGFNLVHSCASCPLAENAETYAKDGFVACHWDDMTSWMPFGGSPKENKKLHY